MWGNMKAAPIERHQPRVTPEDRATLVDLQAAAFAGADDEALAAILAMHREDAMEQCLEIAEEAREHASQGAEWDGIDDVVQAIRKAAQGEG